MRLTINMDADLYAVARSFAAESHRSISTAVNVLLRRGLDAAPEMDVDDTGLPRVRGRMPITSDDVARLDQEPT